MSAMAAPIRPRVSSAPISHRPNLKTNADRPPFFRKKLAFGREALTLDGMNASEPTASRPPYTREQILGELKTLLPEWHSPIDLGFGINTAPRKQTRFARRLKLLGIPADLKGMRVLDMGTWDGFFAFEMERRGADVFVIDMWDDAAFQQFDFARRAKQSRVQGEKMDAQDVTPERLGQFDLILCAGLLYHLRYPLAALEAIRTICKGRLILETVGMVPFVHGRFPMIAFFPGDDEAMRTGRYWGISGAATAAWVVEALRSAGFSRCEVVHEPSARLWKRLAALVRNRPQGGRLIVHAFVEQDAR
jgi:tRNA (mo5U34)-methyltransferase